MMNWRGTGLSVMEMSHRSKEFRMIADKARASLRAMLSIPDDFEIFFTQGGSQMQQAAICYNLLGKYKAANFLITGNDSRSAQSEMSKFCKTHLVSDTTFNISLLANSESWSIEQSADFFHIVDDDKVSGFELSSDFPFGRVPPEQPLVCDMTGSFLTKPIEWERYGVVYAGAEKHSATGGSCITVVRRDLIGKHAPNTPSMLAWASYRDQPDSFPNTPNTWGVYMLGLNLDYMLGQGGLGEMHARTLARSAPIYDFVAQSKGFYQNLVPTAFRSRTNIAIVISS
mmetsp:Transcript_4403/g.5400  ORF Transcript_4403/g.5400 Transcript_4403/m.5400 type:complete len:285 (+) Transcript_4403:2039-2893(+)